LGLDPQTRESIWQHLLEMQKEEEVTIFLTTHYMDEAEHCDRIAIIDYGSIVALDTPEILKAQVGGDIVTLEVRDAEAAYRELVERYHISPRVDSGLIRFEVEQGSRFIPDFVRGFAQDIQAVSLRSPTLDDVFLKLTGRAIREEEGDSKDMMRAHMRAWTRGRQ
jgi:ABC-2 type transport system ATP-binding protein